MKDRTINRILNLLGHETINIKESILELQNEIGAYDKNSPNYTSINYSIAHYKRLLVEAENDLEEYREYFNLEVIQPLPIK